MVKMPSQLGELAVPRSTRGIATIDPGPIFDARREGAAAISRGFGQLADNLMGASVALQRRKDEDEDREIKQLDVELTKKRREINAEFRKTAGQNTLDARPQLDKKYNQARDELLKKASSSKVKQAFTLVADSKAQADLEQQDGYTEVQRRQANMDASEAVMTEAYNSAIESPLDEAVSVLSERQIQDEVLSQAELQGWTTEVTQQKMDAAVSQLYKQRINAAASDYPDQAWEIYRQNKEGIIGADRVEIEKLLEQVTLTTIAQGAAAEAISLYPGDPGAQRKHVQETLTGKQEEAALSKLQEELEFGRGEIRWNEYLKDQAYQEIARADALDQRNQRLSVDEAQDNLNAYLRAAPGVNTRTKWETENPDMAESLNKDVYKSNTMDALETRLLTESMYAEVTNPKTITKYNGATVPDLAALTETDIMAEQANMTQNDWMKWERRVRGAKASMAAASDAGGRLFSAGKDAILRFAPHKGNKVAGKAKLTDTQLNNAQAEMTAWINDQITGGTIPKQVDVDKKAQSLVLQITADPTNTGALWGPYRGEESWEGTVAEMRTMSPQQKAVARAAVDQVPPDMKLDIEADLKEAGIDPTDELIGDMAAAIALGDQIRYNKLLGR
jgi:hypothetical protein